MAVDDGELSFKSSLDIIYRSDVSGVGSFRDLKSHIVENPNDHTATLQGALNAIDKLSMSARNDMETADINADRI